MALISMSTSVTRPLNGANESCIALTEPLEVCVVNAAHNAEASAPMRTSLPSISAGELALAECASDHSNSAVDAADIVSIVPNTNAVRRLRPVR